ncbi:hypothetical protein Tco_0853367 [Tanacetum coccineum]
MIADAIQQERENLRSEISSQINDAISNHIPSQVDSSVRNYMSGHIFHVHPTQATPTSIQEQQQQLYLTMRDNPQLQQDDLSIWIALKYKFERLHVATTPLQRGRRRMSMKPLCLENHPLDFESEQDDDEILAGKVSQELVDEMSHSVDEAKYNPHAKIFYIKKQKEPRKPKEVVYSNSKIVQIIKTYWELGHEHKFITEIVVRRANGSIVSITESDYKNLNKNDIEDMYLIIVNNKVDNYAETGVESYQQKANLTAPTITFLCIEKYKMFFIVFEPVYGTIYKNNKKEKRVRRHQEVHKFYDATLKRVLEGLKSYNNDVKHGYVTPSLSNEDVEYL